MPQRNRSSAAFVLIGAAGFLTLVGAVVFSVVRSQDLSAAEGRKVANAFRDQPAAAQPPHSRHRSRHRSHECRSPN